MLRASYVRHAAFLTRLRVSEQAANDCTAEWVAGARNETEEIGELHIEFCIRATLARPVDFPFLHP